MEMKSENISQLAAALAKAQAEFKEIKRDCTAKIKTNKGYEYEYKYASLHNVREAITAALAKNELSITHPIQEGKISTLLMHSSGEFISSTMPLRIPEGRPQEFGSLVTYYRRYQITALLGVVADDDDDGQGATTDKKPEANQAKTQKTNQRPPNKAPGAEKPVKWDPTEMIKAFEGIDKTVKDMEAYVQTNKANFTQKERATLYKWYQELVKEKKAKEASGEVAS